MINDAESYLNIDLTASKRNMNTTLMVLNKNSSTFYPVFILQKYIIFYMINQHNWWTQLIRDTVPLHFFLLNSIKMTYNNHAVHIIYLCLQTNKIQ